MRSADCQPCEGVRLSEPATEAASDMAMKWLSPWLSGAIALAFGTLIVVGLTRGWFFGRVDPVEARRIDVGRAVYRANCAQCHGIQAEGQANWQSPNPDWTVPAPPHNPSGHTWHHADGLLFRIVLEGGTIYEGPGFKSAMPGFGDQLSEEQIRSVIAYLKTFWDPSQRDFQAAVSQSDPLPGG